MRMKTDRRRPYWLGVIAGLVLTVAAFGTWWLRQIDAPAPAAASASTGQAAPIHVLFLGVDERQDDTGRADTMVLARIGEGRVQTLSIPRDALVALNGYGDSKVNAAYAYGGAALAKEAVATLLGVSVDYYVKVNLAGFRHIVDLVGGVPMEISQAMEYYDPTDGLEIDLKPGMQVLNGSEAEQFVRWRHDGVGDDIGRIGRQQGFLKALAARALSPANLPRIPALLSTARSYVETDLGTADQIRMAYQAYTAQQQQSIVQETVPGHGEYVDGISYFLVDFDALRQLLSRWQAPDAPTA